VHDVIVIIREIEMKKIILACVVVCMTATFALAEWLVDFKDNYANKGIDIAVEEAMKAGITPDAIVDNGLGFDGLNPQNLVRALYCAGALGQDVQAAATKYGISELIVAAGYKKAVEECGDRVADVQAFTPVATARPSFPGLPSNPGGGSYASPSTF
jgi:hypothetical protein